MKQAEIKAWLMYYWRSLFYSYKNIPPRRKVDEKGSDQSRYDSSLKSDEPDEDENDAATVELNDRGLKAVMEGHLDQQTLSELKKDDATKPFFLIVSPLSLLREVDGEQYEFFPFWFVLCSKEDGTLSVPKDFKCVYVPRRFMVPIGGQYDYRYEEDYLIEFTSCDLYEKHYRLQSNDYDTYIKEVFTAFEKLTGGLSVRDYQNRDESLVVNRAFTLRVENPSDFTMKIRKLYSENLQARRGLPPLLRSLIQGRKGCVSSKNQSTLDLGKVHLGQMKNGFPLSPSQRKALLTWLANESKEDIMVVNGPPGTGKTTMIQSIIATKIVESAISGDEPFMALCCASTHKAVTNIIDSFSDKKNTSPHWLTGIDGYATYYAGKKDTTGRYMHIYSGRDEKKSFASGPALPIEGDSEQYVETQQYYLTARVEFCEKGREEFGTDSLDGIVSALHKRLLTFKKAVEVASEASKKASKGDDQELRRFWRKYRRDLLANRLTASKELSKIKYQDLKKDPLIVEDLLDMSYRYQAFVTAVHYWEARWLQAFDREGNAPENARERGDYLRRKAMLTPCFVSTIHSSVGLMSHYGPNRELEPLYSFADYLIMDEAGQTLPELGIAPFCFAKKALVFGDAEQLEPIGAMSDVMDVGNLRESDISVEKDDLDYYGKERKMLSATGNMVGFAQSSCAIVDDDYKNEAGTLQRGIVLTEHRRCREEIISYCNDLVYGGNLIPLKAPEPKYLYTPFVFIPTCGKAKTSRNSKSKFNEEEAESIVRWIVNERSTIESHYGKCIEDVVAIVTPFKEQASILIPKLKSAGICADEESLARKKEVERSESIPKKPLVVGTVHKLQGAQSPLVLFSSVYGPESKSMPFMDSKTNMLNVAVSRAQDSFIVFGNPRLYHNAAMRHYRTFIDEEIQPVPSGLLKAYCSKYCPATPYAFDGRLCVHAKEPEYAKTLASDCEPIMKEMLDTYTEVTFEQNIPLSKVCSDILGIDESDSRFTGDERRFIWDTDSHFDFLLMSENSTMLVIEVDGKGHQKESQQERDECKDGIVSKLGFRMMRLSSETPLSMNDIKARIHKSLTLEYERRHSFMISYELFLSGKTIEQISKERGFRIETIKDHMYQAVKRGYAETSEFISETRLQALIEQVDALEPEDRSLSRIHELLNGEYDYFEIAMVLLI